MSTPQEYWDACLIKTWRSHGTLLDVIQMFKSIVGKDIREVEPPLLRIPRIGVPWGIGVRVYMAAHLEKISARLWEQQPEKDVLMLKKLQTSKYDTTVQNTVRDNEMETQKQKLYTNRKRIGMSTLAVSNRNSDTDWNKTKSVRSKTR